MNAETEWLDPNRCAVVVVDLQNDFCHEEGTFARIGYDVSGVQSILPSVNALIDASHAANVPVILLRSVGGPWSDTPGWARRPRVGDNRLDRIPLVQDGTWGAELYGMVPDERDLVLTKHRYSGFSYTPLELALRAKLRDTVVLAGALTEVCVEATAVDAISAGFFAVLVRQATMSASKERQTEAETAFADRIGMVADLEQVVAAWS